MVSVLDSSVEGRWVELMALKLVFAASPLDLEHLVVRAKTGRPRVRIMYLGEAARLPADCCFHEFAG